MKQERGVSVILLAFSFFSSAQAFGGPGLSAQKCRAVTSRKAGTSSWAELEESLGGSYSNPLPVSIDSVLDPSTPEFSSQRPTLFRERHGWCPYSERVWLALEISGIEYDTVRIDNTGHGPRPSYYSGQTPQMKWPDGRTQGESMDLVKEVDRKFCGGALRSDDSDVEAVVRQFSTIFPRARPSSRAAYLFQYNGEPLWKSTFEQTLSDTDNLIGETAGPFLCGPTLSAADIAWAPFLERYRYQLPCLHEGLDPASHAEYPRLAAWYEAMETVPEYACRVKGDASSWRKVLTMAGFGNSGVPPLIQSNMDMLLEKEEQEARECIDLEVWQAYASTRSHVASTPHLEAASIISKNRKAICADVVKQANKSIWKGKGLPESEEAAEEAVQGLVKALLSDGSTDSVSDTVASLSVFLDERMCVPRDMGSMSAGTIKTLAATSTNLN